MKNKITLIYILGAGRSGSTILSTVLGASDQIFNCADLMQIYEYVSLNKKCNDGNILHNSPFWSKVLEKYDLEKDKNYSNIADKNRDIEFHDAFLKVYFNKINQNILSDYIHEQQLLIKAIESVSSALYILDSSKYPTRALLLRKSNDINIKIIYNIRDIRGVIYSFSKNVQTPKSFFSALLYYIIINIMSELTYFRFKRTERIKIKYEDLTGSTNKTLSRLSSFLSIDFTEIINSIEKGKQIEIGPVIEGNRMVRNKRVNLYSDEEWRSKTSWYSRILYYLLALPFMMRNKYRI